MARLGVQVGSDPKAQNAATGRSDGALFPNYTPTGEEMLIPARRLASSSVNPMAISSEGRRALARCGARSITPLRTGKVITHHTRKGLGANLPEDAIYPLNLGDDSGKPLDGATKYTIHFDKGATPPADAFWSITLYDQEGFQVPNNLNRFAVSSWMPFQHSPDGSLDLYFQNESPGSEKEANWLPLPKGPSTFVCASMLRSQKR